MAMMMMITKSEKIVCKRNRPTTATERHRNSATKNLSVISVGLMSVMR